MCIAWIDWKVVITFFWRCRHVYAQKYGNFNILPHIYRPNNLIRTNNYIHMNILHICAQSMRQPILQLMVSS